jgi:hypothetical protein
MRTNICLFLIMWDRDDMFVFMNGMLNLHWQWIMVYHHFLENRYNQCIRSIKKLQCYPNRNWQHTAIFHPVYSSNMGLLMNRPESAINALLLFSRALSRHWSTGKMQILSERQAIPDTNLYYIFSGKLLLGILS